jgi:hypothetical protein
MAAKAALNRAIRPLARWRRRTPSTFKGLHWRAELGTGQMPVNDWSGRTPDASRKFDGPPEGRECHPGAGERSTLHRDVTSSPGAQESTTFSTPMSWQIATPGVFL